MLKLLVASLIISGVIDAAPEPPPPVKLIYDTDMGNDVDDALALAVIHALADRGECELLAVTVTKDHSLSAPFIDAVNTFYGRGEIPVGVVRDGPTRKDSKFTGIAERYPHDLKKGEDAPEATALLREILAAQPDGSVVIAQVGFSTNLARLLDSGPDEHSPLDGRALAEKKIRVVSAMAGAFKPHNGKPHPEYNVVKDIPAAQRLTRDWPTPIIYSGFEIGLETALPQDSLKYDYRYMTPHIIEEAYRHYNNDYHDQPSWDLTSVLWAVRPDRDYFSLSPKGQVSYDDAGVTSFGKREDGPHQYLIADEAQAERVREVLSVLSSQPPGRVLE